MKKSEWTRPPRSGYDSSYNPNVAGWNIKQAIADAERKETDARRKSLFEQNSFERRVDHGNQSQ